MKSEQLRLPDDERRHLENAVISAKMLWRQEQHRRERRARKARFDAARRLADEQAQWGKGGMPPRLRRMALWGLIENLAQ